MRRIWVALAIIAAFGAGCLGAPAPIPTPSKTTLPVPIPSTSAPLAMPEIVLTADLSGQIPHWHRIAFFPIGDGRNELGYKPSDETPTIEPSAFAVASDGSFWIIDAAKHRVVHFSRDGHLISDFHELLGSGSRDLVFIGDHLFVDGVYHRGLVYEVDQDGHLISRHTVTQGGFRTVYLTDFIPTPEGLYAEIGGYTDPVATGPIGIYQVDLPGTGQIHEAPGIPLRSGTWFWLSSSHDGSYDFHYLRDRVERVQPVRIDVVATKQFGTRRLIGPVGAENLVVDGDDVYMFVLTSVTKPHSDGDQIGGRFLLRVGESPMLFERLPEGNLIDDTQHRHIALGPDGQLYLMLIDKDGVALYRR
jgi:hypothetical protein